MTKKQGRKVLLDGTWYFLSDFEWVDPKEPGITKLRMLIDGKIKAARLKT